MQALASCHWILAYDPSLSGADSTRTFMMKELRIWNKALSLYELKLTWGYTLPPRYPDLAAMVKFT